MTEDFDRYDLILMMNWDNLALVHDICPPSLQKKVHKLIEFCLKSDSPVIPDSYYGGADGSDPVLDLVEGATEARR